jgi:hypothetical protein
MKPLKSLCPLSLALLLTANLVFAQFGGQRLPTTPPTFPQQKSSDRPELIDINSASKEQLLTLPGIDESRAEKIIETRPQAKSAVLNSLSSGEAQRCYRHAIDEFVDWYCSEPRLSSNKTVVLRYRIHLGHVFLPQEQSILV